MGIKDGPGRRVLGAVWQWRCAAPHDAAAFQQGCLVSRPPDSSILPPTNYLANAGKRKRVSAWLLANRWKILSFSLPLFLSVSMSLFLSLPPRFPCLPIFLSLPPILFLSPSSSSLPLPLLSLFLFSPSSSSLPLPLSLSPSLSLVTSLFLSEQASIGRLVGCSATQGGLAVQSTGSGCEGTGCFLALWLSFSPIATVPFGTVAAGGIFGWVGKKRSIGASEKFEGAPGKIKNIGAYINDHTVALIFHAPLPKCEAPFIGKFG